MDLKTLERENVIQKGHFLLTSGLHSDTYFEKFRLLENPKILVELVSNAIKKMSFRDIDYVLGPTVGGIAVAYEFARQLKCRAAYIEKREEKMGLFRGTPVTSSHRLLLVDDVLTTGKSIYQMIEAVSDFKGNIKALAVLINRSKDLKFDWPLYSAMDVDAQAYAPESCKLCEESIPLVRPGGKR
ncbi:MAG: phosphoribosyltransferase family protein [bacterium]|nr:phosphoribosyltransferase family protein [bacterium]